MKKNVIISFCFLISFSILLGQPKIGSEKFENNTYSLSIQYDGSYVNNINKFFGSKDNEEIPSFHSSVFVNIDANSKYVINVNISDKQDITDLLSPQIKNMYQENYLSNDRSSVFENNGELDLHGKKCIHLSLTRISESGGKFYLNTDYSIEVKYQSEVNINIPSNIKEENKYILNKSYSFPKQKSDLDITLNDGWIDDNSDYVKILVNEDNIYRITVDDLKNIGVNTNSIDVEKLKIYLRGNQIPIYVNTGIDNLFNDSDFIEFVGTKNWGENYRQVSEYDEPYNEYINRYTDTTTYWLTWEGTDGLRVKEDLFNSNPIYDTLDYYYELNHYEINNWFDFAEANLVRRQFPYWTENKTWIHTGMGVGTKNINFALDNVYPNKPSYAYSKIHAYASDISQNAHSVTLGINSAPANSDTINFNKYDIKTLSYEYNSDNLTDGTNRLKIISLPTSASLNVVNLDWHEIEYPRYLIAEDNFLKFSLPYIDNQSPFNFQISNFTEENGIIWQFNDGYKRFTGSSNNQNILFTDTLSKKKKYILSTHSNTIKPIIHSPKKIIKLDESNTQADYILLTHKKFFNKALEYADFIEAEYSINAIVIDVENIYDQFNYGIFNPESIREFLKSVNSSWQNPKPKYLFIVGGATYDFNRNKHIFQDYPVVQNYVPSFGMPVSDNWFVTWDTTGANLPQMHVGRLPATKLEQFDWYFQKHKLQRATNYSKWNKRFLFFTGGEGDNEAELNQLKSVNDFIVDNYATPSPVSGESHHFYKTINPNTNFGPISQHEYEKVISEGGIFIAYLGHSGTRTWDNSITEPYQLQSDFDLYPLVSDFGCSTVKFAEPDVTSFSELFTLENDGQAISYIGNSSLGFLSTATIVPKLFYKNLLRDSVYTIAEALYNAKNELLSNYGASQTNQLFILTNSIIGDPVVSIKLPPLPNLVTGTEKVKLENRNPTDNLDSLLVLVQYENHGKSIIDSFVVSVAHTFNGMTNTFELKKNVPGILDSIEFNLPIKDKPGKHNFSITLDANSEINEIYEDDNFINYEFIVSSSLFRPLTAYQFENSIYSDLSVVNPINEESEENFIFKIDSDENFQTAESYIIDLDTIITRVPIEYFSNGRNFFQFDIPGKELNSNIFSTFKSDQTADYYIGDEYGYNTLKSESLVFEAGRVYLGDSEVNFSVLSAGFNDGRTILINKNGQNYAFQNTLRGHHVCTFNVHDYSFGEYKHFDLLRRDSLIEASYIEFLDTLSSDYYVLIGVSDEGRVLNNEIKDIIKSLGSQYIDSVGFRYSWGFIGRKGAQPGTMPEMFSPPTFGSVTVDTSFIEKNADGYFETVSIGPSSTWKNMVVQDTLPNNSSITYKPILISQTDNSEDTLAALNMVNGEVSLSFIDAEKYPHIKMLAEFEAGDNNTSPELYSLGVDYIGIPELATNYQVVSVEKDTVQQGEDATLHFYVYNVGESTADSFKVQVDVIKPDNSKEQIYSTTVDSLGAEQRKKFDIEYSTTNFNGSRTFAISIDSDNRIMELYEDNNFYNIPFYVLGDTTKPSLNLTIDGRDIFDGEYISSTPQIKVELSDPSLVPITDTSSVSIYLNNKYQNYAGNENILKVNFSESNPKVTLDYTPTLEDGEYTLRIFGKDASGNIGDSSGMTKTFVVQNDPKILQVYNYPNPFNDETYFTFKLTQIPDEIKIKVFTVAGRLIKEIKLSGSQLNFDLNKIYWDGRDDDGDLLGNGVYLYKVIMDVNGKIQDITQKLAVVR